MPHAVVRRAALLCLLASTPLFAQTTAPTGTIDATRFAPALGIDLSTVERLAPTLYRRDITTGDGAALRLGERVTFRIRTARADGTVLDTGNVPITLEWRSGLFVPGVERGIAGMRIGGHRQLILGPGAGGARSDDGVVVIDVELLAAN